VRSVRRLVSSPADGELGLLAQVHKPTTLALTQKGSGAKAARSKPVAWEAEDSPGSGRMLQLHGGKATAAAEHTFTEPGTFVVREARALLLSSVSLGYSTLRACSLSRAPLTLAHSRVRCVLDVRACVCVCACFKVNAHELALDGTVAATHAFRVTAKVIRYELRDLDDADRETYFDTLHTFYTLGQADGEALYGSSYKSISFLVSPWVLPGRDARVPAANSIAAASASMQLRPQTLLITWIPPINLNVTPFMPPSSHAMPPPHVFVLFK
jgi:hypothetical protein